jgi:tRNA(adenine34) deaminase
MTRALDVAVAGMTAGEMPIGAVVVLDGEVVSEAHTQESTQHRLLVHADLLALEEAERTLGFRARGASLYVTLEPCVMCLGAAFAMRIGTVVYALESPSDAGHDAFVTWDRQRRSSSMPGYALPVIRPGVLRSESAALFRSYADHAPVGWARDWATELASQADG